MKITSKKNSFKGVQEIIPVRHEDKRGYFVESYNKKDFALLGINDEFVQDNYSYTSEAETIRGMHFQIEPAKQSKLIRVIRGKIMDVFIDIRSDSSTYKQWGNVILSAENGKQLYLPIGFAHGFKTLEDNCEIEYKVSDYYSPEHERGVRWDDPEINIDWGMDNSQPTLSDKDSILPFFSELKSPCT